MKKVPIVILILAANLLIGQENSLYKEIGVKKVEEYIFDVINLGGQEDSVLTKLVLLDSMGRIRYQGYKIQGGHILQYKHYYKQGKVSKIRRITNNGKSEKTEVSFKYDSKGNLKLKKKYSNGSIVGKEFFKFDSKGRIRERVIKNYSYSGKKIFLYLYNEKGQKIKEYTTSKDHSNFEFEYDAAGNEITMFKIDDKKGKVFYVVKEYDEFQRITKEKKYCDSNFLLPDVKQKIEALKGDIWLRKFKYNELGLVVEVRQWLNNILVGIKKIKYEL